MEYGASLLSLGTLLLGGALGVWVSRKIWGARLEAERRLSEEKLKLLEEARIRLADSFKALSAESLRANNSMFLDLAKSQLGQFQQEAKGDLEKRQQSIQNLIQPVRESLDKMDVKLQDLEKARTGAYEAIRQQVQGLYETQQQLRSETSNLVKALRSPVVRGRWGEIQLRRVVEMAGMVDHCDFYEQTTAESEDGKLRPDLLVRLPGNKFIVVDSKAPLEGYLEAMDAVDDQRRLERLKDHARHIRTHMSQLSRKSYWDQFQPSPEFVVLFLPGETFFSAALEQDPGLIEAGVDQRVILATPTTLIALLRAVAYGWRHEHLEENARQIGEIGRDLYKRLADMGGHLSKLGTNLKQSVEAYNRTVGSFESRVLVSARKFKELKAAPESVELSEMQQVELLPRALLAKESATE